MASGAFSRKNHPARHPPLRAQPLTAWVKAGFPQRKTPPSIGGGSGLLGAGGSWKSDVAPGYRPQPAIVGAQAATAGQARGHPGLFQRTSANALRWGHSTARAMCGCLIIAVAIPRAHCSCVLTATGASPWCRPTQVSLNLLRESLSILSWSRSVSVHSQEAPQASRGGGAI